MQAPPANGRRYTLSMPKRTNTFQAVMFAIKQHLAGDATVTESEELIDFISGDKREVDICIKTQVAGHSVIISIECRDHQRPQPVGWVEEMQSKHSRLPTDRLVSYQGLDSRLRHWPRLIHLGSRLPCQKT